jgi:hypothetical protein
MQIISSVIQSRFTAGRIAKRTGPLMCVYVNGLK